MKQEVWLHKHVGFRKDEDTGERTEIWVPVCSPFTVTALLKTVDADDAHGLRIKLRDMNGEPRFLDIDRGDLARLGAAEIRARLLRAGMQIANGGEATVIEILKAHKPDLILTVSIAPGLAPARTGADFHYTRGPSKPAAGNRDRTDP